MMNVLLVEDELSIAESLVYAMETEYFKVKHAMTGSEALAYLEEMDGLGEEVDIAILDLGLPDISGFDLCKQIQEKYSMPVMFLTARDNEIDRVLGLELGGDDYVVKPFSPREVTARVRAILRRCGKQGAREAQAVEKKEQAEGLEHDVDRKVFVLKGEVLSLTANEYRLLLAFFHHPGRVFDREQLLEQAWDDPGAVMDRTVDAHVKSLRSKLKAVSKDVEWIETRRGLGYAMKVLGS